MDKDKQLHSKNNFFINNKMDTESNEEIITLHIAKRIINENCFVYKDEVIDHITIDDIVRISFTVATDLDVWSHDSPYVKIVSDEEDDTLLGVIVDINRQVTNKYPLNIGDKIWFKKENIIALHYNVNKQKFLTKEKVLASGPLYTIEYDESDESDDESSYSSASESE